MPVYPNYSNNDDAGRSIVRQMEENWETHSRQNLYFQTEAAIDYRFYVGEQQVWYDMYGSSIPPHRQNFSVNLMQRLVHLPVGYQMDHRRSIVTTPIEGSDQLTADQFTKLLLWNDRKAKVQEMFSDAFKGACIGGLNWVTLYQDYSNDPISGDTCVDNVTYNQAIFDPFMSKLDMSDCDFWWRRNYVTKRQAKALLPGHDYLIDTMNYSVGQMTDKDGKFQFTPQSVFGADTKLFTYDDYFYRSYRTQKKLANPSNTMQFEWNGSDKDLREYKQYLRDQFPDEDIEVIENDIPTVHRAVVVNGQVVTQGERYLGLDTYPCTPVVGYWTPESTALQYKIQGIVRGLRDSQFLFNKFLCNAMDSLDAQFSGYIAKEDSVVNPKSLHKTGPGQVIWRKKDSMPDDISKIEPPAPATGQWDVVDRLTKMMIDQTGQNEASLGQADDDMAGILAMLKQGQGMLAQKILFDNLDRSMKHFANIRMKVFQNTMVPEKVERVLGEQPSQEFYDRTFGQYDCVVEDGYDTSTQRQLAFAQSLKLKEMGAPIPWSFIMDNAALQNKTQLQQIMQQEEQAQAQAQQQQQQMAMQEQQATIKMAEAQAQYQEAGQRERDSRVYENIALMDEREAEALKDREQALLNKMKALREFEDIEIDQIYKFLEISRLMKEQEQMEMSAKSGEQVAKAEMIKSATQQPEQGIPSPVEQPPIGVDDNRGIGE